MTKADLLIQQLEAASSALPQSSHAIHQPLSQVIAQLEKPIAEFRDWLLTHANAGDLLDVWDGQCLDLEDRLITQADALLIQGSDLVAAKAWITAQLEDICSEGNALYEERWGDRDRAKQAAARREAALLKKWRRGELSPAQERKVLRQLDPDREQKDRAQLINRLSLFGIGLLLVAAFAVDRYAPKALQAPIGSLQRLR